MNSDVSRKPLVMAYYQKLRSLKAVTRDRFNPLANTSGYVQSPKVSSKLNSNLNRTKLSLERSTSSHKMQHYLLSSRNQGKRLISQNDESKLTNTSKSQNEHNIWDIVNKLNARYLQESKDNNTGVCLQLLEPVLVHNMCIIKFDLVRLPPQKQINADLCACVNAQDINGNTALHFAVKNQNAQLVQALLYKKINLNIQNGERMTAITLAAYQYYDKLFSGNEDILEMLINAGADINHQDMYGNTPLHYACKQNHKEIVQILLKQSPLLFKVNSDRKYPDYYIKDQEILLMFTQFQEEHKSKQICNLEKTQNQTIENDVIIKMFKQKSQKQIRDTNQEQKPVLKKYKSSNSIQNQFNSTTTFSTNNSESIKKIEEAVKPEQFEVMGLIGKGSFGEVYLVSKQKQLYAMKVMHKSLIINNNICRYAQTERNVLSVTSHPFIVKLRYAFQTNDKLFMVLDFCPGGDLGQVLRQVRRLPEPLVKLYMCEIILAIEDLHKRDIIFRDLKPDNIVLDAEGHAMLTDFGLSKEGIYETNAGAKSFCGSIAYLAPEMLKRQGHGKSVDWYLLGVVMYELMVGLPPYYSDNREELFHNIQNANLKIPSFISSDARNLLQQLLQRDPGKRLGSVKDYEEVKSHPYFSNIDWQLVLNREIDMPKPKGSIKLKPPVRVFDQQQVIENSHFSGWSYIE